MTLKPESLSNSTEADSSSEDRGARNPTVRRLGWVSFFADIASEMLYPITPLFLTQSLGASMTAVGVIEATAEATASLVKIGAGGLSDRLKKRKIFVCTGYFLAAVSKPWIGLAGSWTQVLFARSTDRVGKGLRTAPRDAMLSDSVSPEFLGSAFGFHRMMDTLGASFGPLLTLIYLQFWSEKDSEALRNLYFWALIPGLLAFVIALTLKEKKFAVSDRKDSEKMSFWNFPKNFRIYLLAWGLFSLGNSSDAFLLLKASSQGLSLTWIILLYSGFNLFYALLSPLLGRWSDRWGRKQILIPGLLFFSLIYAGFSQAESLWQFAFLFSAYGLFMAATDGVGKALAIDCVSPTQKALALGLLSGITGFCSWSGSITAGFLWDHGGSASAFLWGSCCALLGAAVLFFVRPNQA